ncbi:probable tubulin polyglutamylase TTLL2 isoform X2 [Zootermopsis nevadensis]|nr:probable tubulin polyglutamylase TTLL2 isoform X2 [Zootermopsis nevadensis]XP_021917354.1 probable tubulin polyglutamylase TTLL2 isoform X2 [Zootermopsis nevadensis]
MKKIYGTIYDFSPLVYNLPLEYTKLVAEFSQGKSKVNSVWICKPVGQSQGRGIFLFKDLGDLCYDSNAIVQRYIQNPLLIGGYKFDLRLYVCIPSYHPLTVYLYREGLVRFGTDKYSMADLNNPFCHLTNSSLNKWGPGYNEKKERIGPGCKWSLKQLRHYFHQTKISDWLLWQRISSLVVLTVVSQLSGIPNTANCFEFYGFDVLIDSSLRPWLLEVNLSPALGNDCDIDQIVKKPMLHDMFDLLGLPMCNTGLSLFTIWSSSSNDDHPESENEDCEDENSREREAQSSALSVVAAASRWKRRHQQKNHNSTHSTSVQRTRKKSASLQTTRHQSLAGCSGKIDSSSRMPCGRKSMTHSTGTKSPIKCSSINQNIAQNSYASTALGYGEDDDNNHRLINGKNSQDSDDAWVHYNPLLIDRSRNRTHGFRGQNKYPPPMLWGNGRDWRSPPVSEGNWIRLYPLGPTAQCTKQEPQEIPTIPHGDKEVKNIVAAVHKYSKTAREIFKLNPTFSDESFSSSMKQTLGMTSEVWLPSK